MAPPAVRTGPRILTITNMYPTQGRPSFGIFVKRQVDALRRLGLDVRLEVVAGDRGRGDYLLARRRIRAAVREFRPHLIHCHYGYTPLAAAFAGVPYVVSLCGDDLYGTSDGRGGITLKSRAGVVVTRLLAIAAARVIVKSRSMRTRLPRAVRRKVEVLPNGVDTRLFAPGSRTEARARLGLPAEGHVICFVNSLNQPTKRLDIAQETRDALLARGIATRLLVAEQVAPDEMPWYYRASDCLLLTSDREGAPNCVKEALACGLPVVGVPVGDLPEVLTAPEMGQVVPRVPGLLADAIEALVPRPDIRASLLPPDLSDEAVAARVAAIYSEVVGSA
jgi:glycosyltransferase involved in cell wall biosynthesis